MTRKPDRKYACKPFLAVMVWAAIHIYGMGMAYGACNDSVLQNNDFETGTTNNWVGHSDGQATFSASSPGKNSAYSGNFSITTEGNDVKMYQSGFTLLPDTIYRLTFDAYSDSGQNLRVLLSDITGNNNYGIDRVIDITNSWNGHEIEFNTPVSATSARLTFWIADWDIAGGTYYFDNICLRIVADITCQDNDSDGYGSPGNSTCIIGAQNDCDENDKFTYPGAPEICNNKDNDCDGDIDEACIDQTPLGTGDTGFTPTHRFTRRSMKRGFDPPVLLVLTADSQCCPEIFRHHTN